MMDFVSFEEARRIQRGSPAPIWHKATTDPTTASERYSTDFFQPALARPKFGIRRDENFFMIGSCFARALEWMLASRSFNVLSATEGFNSFVVGAAGTTALGATNRYNLASIKNELVWALEGRQFPERAIVALDEERYFDPHMTPVFSPARRDEVLLKHRIMTETMSKIADSDVIIVTLGLVEVWKDAELELIVNAIHPNLLRKYPDRFLFGRLDYFNNLALLNDVYDLLKRHARPGFRMIVTVSPVPLAVTFTGRDVVEASTYSKSVLRVVAEDFANEKANVEYFPSYEIVMNSARTTTWDEDCRHVRFEMANFITARFVEHFLPEEKAASEIRLSPQDDLAPTPELSPAGVGRGVTSVFRRTMRRLLRFARGSPLDV